MTGSVNMYIVTKNDLFFRDNLDFEVKTPFLDNRSGKNGLFFRDNGITNFR